MASGVFAVAPFIIGGAVFSAVAIALSAVVISKNNTISQQEKFESRVAQRKQEEENARAELKAKGSLPDIVELPYKLSSVPDIIALPHKDDQG